MPVSHQHRCAGAAEAQIAHDRTDWLARGCAAAGWRGAAPATDWRVARRLCSRRPRPDTRSGGPVATATGSD
eukprot:2751799-Prymnesium_polylepis.3